MASVKIVYVEDINCPVCFEIFKTPVLLSCSHSICKDCLQQFWKNRDTQDCPICRRRYSRDEPLCNLVLKNLSESITAESASGSEEVCSLHNEKLKLFCLDDKQPVCIVFSPIDEVVPSYKEQLFYQIKEEFTKLHQFLQDEEEASITALRKEEEQKSQMMKEKLEEMNRQISDLSDTIKDIEEKMNTSILTSECYSRAHSSQQDPQMLSGALINVSDHLRNLTFRVCKKMQQLVQNSPVTLDPNTANTRLILSDELTSLRHSKTQQPVPNNPVRFHPYACVLGSEAFNSGTHFWDVEVGVSSYWIIKVTTESIQRKGTDFFYTNVWSGLGQRKTLIL
uniref:Tripartite motif containing 35-29 n=1 Tax=Cyprinus carpio carpio TaxID=630221 RepID=A0A8C1CLA3_CYPCA